MLISVRPDIVFGPLFLPLQVSVVKGSREDFGLCTGDFGLHFDSSKAAKNIGKSYKGGPKGRGSTFRGFAHARETD